MRLFLDSEFLNNYKKSPTAMISSFIIIAVILIALFGPYFTVQNPYDLGSLNLIESDKPPAWMQGGEPRFLLGTDQNGRDILSAIIYGSRVSIYIGILGVFLTSLVGISLGLVAGYFGGKFDIVIMRIADIQLAFPSMLIALFLMGISGPSVGNILIALTLIGWVRYTRIVRGEVLSVREKEYVDAAKVVGFSHGSIILKQILPNVLTSVIVISTLRLGAIIMTEATLSFLGVGVPASSPSLGMLCSDGFKVLYSGLWWVSIFPGLYIVTIVFAVNLLGDFLRDELNPRLK
jgi:peptide/nickel transport system permease protein